VTDPILARDLAAEVERCHDRTQPEEAIDDLTGHGQDDELERIETSLFDLRRACAVGDLLALVKTLTTISRSFQRGKMVKTLLVM